MARKRTHRGHRMSEDLGVGASAGGDDVAPLLAQVDCRADELCRESIEFIEGQMRADRACTSIEAFDRWTICKLAGLQILVEMLNHNIMALTSDAERRLG